MEITGSPNCMAVSQGVVYAAVTGFQPDGGDGTLLTLIKTVHPATANGNNTWSVISVTPSGYFGRNGLVDCDVDKNGVFTMRLNNGAGYRYDPLASKVPRAQTCSSNGNGLGEWKRMDLIGPDEVNSWRRLILQPEVIPSVDNKINTVQNTERNANRTTYNKTLVYFPFEAPFHLTNLPSSAISVPWNVDCDGYDAFSAAVVANSKFYYVCTVPRQTTSRF
ncbi:hypothetical protein BGZ81_000930 [Podila clonocystis]|nr:hypothetical protein BGZ81_000930 [Podila clonocystis]